MISLRLTRVGKKKRPVFRLIAIDKRRDPWGRAIEILGVLDPRTKERTLKADRIKHWLSEGAQPTETVRNILIDEKIVEGKKSSVTHISKKRQGKMAEKTAADAEAKAEAKAKAKETKAAEAEAPAEAPKETLETPETPATPETPTTPAA